MPGDPKEEMKTIKIAASTHARLLMLSNISERTVSQVIDDLMETAYPDILAEADKILDQMESVRAVLHQKQSRKKNKAD